MAKKQKGLEQQLNEVELKIIANIDDKKKIKELETERLAILKKLGRKP